MTIPSNNYSFKSMFNAIGFSLTLPPSSLTPRVCSYNESIASLVNMFTSDKGLAYFEELITETEPREILSIAFIIALEPDCFFEIVSNRHGSSRVVKLLGLSKGVDGLFCHAILKDFLKIMTSQYGSYMAIRGLSVFGQRCKELMSKKILHHALDLARDQHGCLALTEAMTQAYGTGCYKIMLVDIVASNALSLSKDPCGNFVVRGLLKVNDLRYTFLVVAGLHGHCVELSFERYGSYVVEKLLETDALVLVAAEILESDTDTLMRLARDEFGCFVVEKALRMTKEVNEMDVFWDLVHKLMPFVDILRVYGKDDIAKILEDCSITIEFSN
ncbi:unnamed protein product [Cochlearia groenlandica]